MTNSNTFKDTQGSFVATIRSDERLNVALQQITTSTETYFTVTAFSTEGKIDHSDRFESFEVERAWASYHTIVAIYQNELDDFKPVKLKDVKKGEYVTRKPSYSATVFSKGDYCRSSKKYSLGYTNDINRELLLKGDTIVYIGFMY